MGQNFIFNDGGTTNLSVTRVFVHFLLQLLRLSEVVARSHSMLLSLYSDPVGEMLAAHGHSIKKHVQLPHCSEHMR